MFSLSTALIEKAQPWLASKIIYDGQVFNFFHHAIIDKTMEKGIKMNFKKMVSSLGGISQVLNVRWKEKEENTGEY